VRFRTFCAIGFVLLAIAACGGGSSETFARTDVLQILEAAPTRPAAATWRKEDGIRQTSPEELRKGVQRTGGAFADAIDALVDAGYQRGFAQGWRSSRTVASVEAALFPDEAAARKGFVTSQHLVPSWFLPLPVEGLGDEAVFSQSDLGAIYMWRRGNVVLSAGILRGGGRLFDYDAAARAYAEALDRQAAGD
jgi:hypothetical protein